MKGATVAEQTIECVICGKQVRSYHNLQITCRDKACQLALLKIRTKEAYERRLAKRQQLEQAVPEEWCSDCWIYEDRFKASEALGGVWDFDQCKETCWKCE